MPQDEGHGEVSAAALTLNFVLACVLAAAGRVVLGRKPLPW